MRFLCDTALCCVFPGAGAVSVEIERKNLVNWSHSHFGDFILLMDKIYSPC